MTTTERLDHIAVALDTLDWDEFDAWCERFGSRVGVLKVGLEAYVRWGSRAVDRARETRARIFLDLKLHDIPNTVAGAVGAAAELGVRYLTVHASGGPRMLAAAVEAAGDEVGILAVTLLTHIDRADLEALDLAGGADARVARWAALAVAQGCAGAVCSPLEVGDLRATVPPRFELVTPGIRLGGSGSDDQRRVATPETAIGAGATLLVVGRPLTRAADPEAVLAALAAAAPTR